MDFIALPTMQNLPPKLPFFRADAVFEWMVFNMQNTIAVNYAGNPASPCPSPCRREGKKLPSPAYN